MAASAPIAAPGRRQYVAILFYDLKNSTGLSYGMENELYDDLRRRLHNEAEAIVENRGGIVVQIEGDGAMCLFGYPDARDDAARRATEAAIDLHVAVAAFELEFGTECGPIRLHSGIHAGMVLVREGDVMRGRFEAIGDPTHVAKRLCDHAGADEIFASEAALGAHLDLFRLGPQQLVGIAGHGEPVPARIIRGREPVRLALGRAGKENSLGDTEDGVIGSGSPRLFPPASA